MGIGGQMVASDHERGTLGLDEIGNAFLNPFFVDRNACNLRL